MAPPWASRYPPERSCLSRVMAPARSPAAIVVSPSRRTRASPKHDPGDLVHWSGERPGGAGPMGGHHRVGGGTHEVRADVAHGLDSPARGVIGASRGDPVGAPVSWRDVAVERDGHLQDSEPCAASFPGWMTRVARVDGDARRR
jgi:hypothetical protein